jgi:hypothetical protein
MGGSGDKSDANKSGEEKDRKKKEDKERSESRISALMGRKRGKVGALLRLDLRQNTNTSDHRQSRLQMLSVDQNR